METTCHNDGCPEIETCIHNIHRDGMRNEDLCPEGQYYMSMKQSIWAEYEKKCERTGVKRMPYNIYFEH